MSQPNVPGGAAPATNLQLSGGAAIVAPPSAFPSGIPGNALIVVPLAQPSDELLDKMKVGPVAIEVNEMWKLLGFNGPAVQVQDQEGRPIAIGLEDLLDGLEKHWQEDKDDIQRARMFAQELMKYGRFEKAEKVLKKVVASGGGGEDWLGLGIAQLQQERWDDAVATLRGSQNLLMENPFPSLHLARALKGKGEPTREREAIERAINIDGNCVDAWAYLFSQIKEQESEEAALTRIKELADAETNKKRSAPYIALQGLYSADEATRDKAIDYAKLALDNFTLGPLWAEGRSAVRYQPAQAARVEDGQRRTPRE